MATRHDPPTNIAELLKLFELPEWLVEPAVRSCRLFNTALDFIEKPVLAIVPRLWRRRRRPAGTWRLVRLRSA
jgi:hypothetical protein